ncbi:hypothetical protein DFH08DRAFT_940119 [Mycena albidolilacea]|uniref:Uncharacterized protein n=1 Tax=Mycena albidolilacea TaxID=1033008 RepID=A0AAD7EKF3_9AGAR|nr:hypothetical protein DFH08DRAFT_940119 [Mycena albidolilacea]
MRDIRSIYSVKDSRLKRNRSPESTTAFSIHETHPPVYIHPVIKSPVYRFPRFTAQTMSSLAEVEGALPQCSLVPHAWQKRSVAVAGRPNIVSHSRDVPERDASPPFRGALHTTLSVEYGGAAKRTTFRLLLADAGDARDKRRGCIRTYENSQPFADSSAQMFWTHVSRALARSARGRPARQCVRTRLSIAPVSTPAPTLTLYFSNEDRLGKKGLEVARCNGSIESVFGRRRKEKEVKEELRKTLKGSRKFRAEAKRARMESIRGPVVAVLELCNFEMKAQARDKKAKSSVFRRKIPTVAEDTDCTALQSAWCHLRTTVEQRQDLSPEKKITDVYATTKKKWNSYGERDRIILARASPDSRVRAKLVRVWERCKNGGARQNSKAGACQWAEPNPGSRERSRLYGEPSQRIRFRSVDKKSKANAVELRWSAGYENAGRKRPVEMTAHGWTASASTSTI